MIWNKMVTVQKDRRYIGRWRVFLTLILSASEVILQAAHLTTHPDVPFDYIIYSCFAHYFKPIPRISILIGGSTDVPFAS